MIADLGKTYNFVEHFFKCRKLQPSEFLLSVPTMMINVISLEEGL